MRNEAATSPQQKIVTPIVTCRLIEAVATSYVSQKDGVSLNDDSIDRNVYTNRPRVPTDPTLGSGRQ